MNTNLKPRPNLHSKEIGQAVAKKLAPAVAEWFQDGTNVRDGIATHGTYIAWQKPTPAAAQ